MTLSVALGLVCLNEAAWLRLHLPVMLRAERVAGVVCVDGGSTDGSLDVVREVAERHGKRWAIRERPWDWRFDEQQNAVIEVAEHVGFSALLKWDPDELMFPADIDQAVGFLERGAKAVVFSRVNFEGDRCHYTPHCNERDVLDQQMRLHVLGEGVRWRGRLHASPNVWDLWPSGETADCRQIVRLPFAPIFHYEGLKPMAQRALKWLNYDLVSQDLDPLSALPDDYEVPVSTGRITLPFSMSQPLDPAVCGARAPYGGPL